MLKIKLPNGIVTSREILASSFNEDSRVGTILNDFEVLLKIFLQLSKVVILSLT
jgi:hypothetical protein